jgi:hypothetical protein
MDRRETLKHCVVDALKEFSGQLYPGDTRLVYDNSRSHLSCATVRDKLTGLDWTEVSESLIVDDVADLFFMTSEARRFYLPAYIKVVVHAPEKYYSLHSGLVDILGANVTDVVEFHATFDGYNCKQRQAIRLFLEYSSVVNPVDFAESVAKAISLFWSDVPGWTEACP